MCSVEMNILRIHDFLFYVGNLGLGRRALCTVVM